MAFLKWTWRPIQKEYRNVLYLILKILNRPLKTACLHKLSDFRDTFPKKVFYVIWSKTILKLAIWHIPGVSGSHFGLSGAIFLKISQNGWNLEFLPFLQKNGWNGQKTHSKWYWELKKKLFLGAKVEKLRKRPFLGVLRLNWPIFSGSNLTGTVCPIWVFMAKIHFSHWKLDIATIKWPYSV